MMTLTEAQNEVIYRFAGKMLKNVLPSSIASAGIEPSKGSKAFTLGRSYGRDRSTGAVNRLGFTMKRHGIYREKGVGRGRGINSGKTIGPPWYNPAIDANINELADDIATVTGDVIAGSLRIR